MQSHLYHHGLLSGQCSDIKLRAFDKVYHLHRLFLIQSGFFRAMLCGGYAEDVAVSAAAAVSASSTVGPSSLASGNYDQGGNWIHLHFDDPNISRAAFEYCIAHLYGGGPKLVLPNWACPSADYPLTPAFTLEYDDTQYVTHLPNETIGSQSHPATPRFLLSLLATSIYLNIPSITSQSMTLILCSMSPYTVSHYLRFAIGKGIEGATIKGYGSIYRVQGSEEWDWELEGPARSLEKLGRTQEAFYRRRGRVESQTFIPDNQGFKHESHKQTSEANQPANYNCLPPQLDALSLNETKPTLAGSAGLKRNRDSFGAEYPANLRSATSSPSSNDGKSANLSDRQSLATNPTPLNSLDSNVQARARSTSNLTDSPKRSTYHSSSTTSVPLSDSDKTKPDFHYGGPADKVGEACTCWLARWGLDILDVEEVAEEDRAQEVENWIKQCQIAGDLDKLAVLRGKFKSGEVDLPSISLLPLGQLPELNSRLPTPHLRVWSYPAMPSSWVRAVISSDSFFVRSESERYTFAKRVVEMRRKQKERINAVEELLENVAEDLSNSESDFDSRPVSEHPSDTQAQRSFGAFGFSSPSSNIRLDRGIESETEVDRTPRTKYRLGDGSGFGGQEEADPDESEYTRLFSDGIYYTHMSFQELNRISTDLSRTTGKPYAPLNTLQAALWAGSELKNHIVSSVRSSSNSNSDNNNRRPSLPPWDSESEDAEGVSHNLADGNSTGVDHQCELGISSTLTEFRQACESASLGSLVGDLLSRSHESSPFRHSTGFRTSFTNVDLASSRTMQSLGGLGASPLLLGSAGGGSALLGKRYYLVPSDDTVRFGDGLSLVATGPGSTTSGSGTQATLPTSTANQDDQAENGPNTSVSGSVVSSLEPTGNAACPIANTIPLPNDSIRTSDPGNTHSTRKHRRNFFGIANGVATGRELGDKATQESRSSTTDTSADHGNRDETTFSCYFGTSAQQGEDSEVPEWTHNNGQPMEAGTEGVATAAGLSASSNVDTEKWTGYEPMRLGVEFFGVDKLQEKQRLYSPTFFYAGSIWNLYIQVVKKAKGTQLGVYLHRQSPKEMLPQPSAPSPLPPTIQCERTEEGEGDAHLQSFRRSQFWASRFLSSSQGTPLVSGSGEAGQTANPPHDDTSLYTTSSSGEPTRNLETMSNRGDGASSFLDSTPSRTNSSGLMARGGVDNAIGSSSTHRDGFGSSITLPSGTTITSNGSTVFGSGGNSSQLAPGSGTGTGTGLLNLSSGNALADGQTPIVPLCPGGPMVYQTCLAPQIAYRDPRKVLRAYFSIHCPSPLGNALTRFSSGPDQFTISQSWGWKSSSLLGIAYLENGHLANGKADTWNRFRCICTIGVV